MPNRPVSAVITDQDCVTVPASTRVSKVAELMKTHRTSAVLVVDAHRERLLGICTERDLVFGVLAEALDPDATTVDRVMTADPLCITPDKPFGHALHLMYENGFRHVPVVDKGKPLGILCARDALGSDALQFEAELIRREEITVIL